MTKKNIFYLAALFSCLAVALSAFSQVEMHEHEYLSPLPDSLWQAGEPVDFRVRASINRLEKHSTPQYYILDADEYRLIAGIDASVDFPNIGFYLDGREGLELELEGLEVCEFPYTNQFEVVGELFQSMVGMAVPYPGILAWDWPEDPNCTEDEYLRIRLATQTFTIKVLDPEGKLVNSHQFDYKIIYNGWYLPVGAQL